MMVEATIYKLQCIYLEGVWQYLHVCTQSGRLLPFRYVDPPTLLLKPDSHTINISLENFDPKAHVEHLYWSQHITDCFSF